MKVTVVGGGITGLAAAYAARRAGADVTLLEASARLGGRIEATEVGGVRVEAGPDAFLARVPEAVDLARAVGLSDELVAPAATEALVWSRGALRPLPKDVLLGVPAGVLGVARSGLLSGRGLLRAGLDVVARRSQWSGDASVAEVVGRRFGPEVVERLVDPLVGGINAGDTRVLSAEAVAPQVVAAARAHRSLLVGARRTRAGAGADGPVFLTVRSGLSALVDRLAVGVDVRLGAFAHSLDELGDRVVLALPASGAAELVERRSPEAAAELRAIRTASVAIVLLAYPGDGFARPLHASGFVVPRVEGRLVTACSFGTAKWPHWSAPGVVVLRASVGRDGDDRFTSLDDEGLVARVHDELVEMVGVQARPMDAVVRRWPDAFPQYDVGHLARVERIESLLARDAPGVVVAGASYRGLGLPACIRQGRAAAGWVLEG